MASAVTASGGKPAAPLCHANGGAVLLALEPIRADLQADLRTTGVHACEISGVYEDLRGVPIPGKDGAEAGVILNDR